LNIMDDKERVEELLINYDIIQAQIKTEIYANKMEYSLDSKSLARAVGNNMSVSSVVEEFVADKDDVDESTLKRCQIYNIIASALQHLNSDERKLVEELYFENRPVSVLANRTGWSKKTVRRRRDNAIYKLIKNGVLKAWSKYEEIEL